MNQSKTLLEALDDLIANDFGYPESSWLADYCKVPEDAAQNAIDLHKAGVRDIPNPKQFVKIAKESQKQTFKNKQNKELIIHRIAKSELFVSIILIISYIVDIIIGISGLLTMVSDAMEIVFMCGIGFIVASAKIAGAIKKNFVLWALGAVITAFLGASIFLSLVTQGIDPNNPNLIAINQDIKSEQVNIATYNDLRISAEKANRLTDGRDLDNTIKLHQEALQGLQAQKNSIIEKLKTEKSASIVFDRFVYVFSESNNIGDKIAFFFSIALMLFIEYNIYKITKKE